MSEFRPKWLMDFFEFKFTGRWPDIPPEELSSGRVGVKDTPKLKPIKLAYKKPKIIVTGVTVEAYERFQRECAKRVKNHHSYETP